MMTSTNVRTIVVTKHDKFPRESDQDDLDAVLSELAYLFTSTNGLKLFEIINQEITEYEDAAVGEIMDKYGLNEDFLEELCTDDDEDSTDDVDEDSTDDVGEDNDNIMKHPCVKEIQGVSLKSAIGYGSHLLRGAYCLPLRRHVDIAKLLNYDNLATVTIIDSEILIYKLSEDRRHLYDFSLRLDFDPNIDEKSVHALVTVLKKVMDKLRDTPQTRSACQRFCTLL